MWNLGDNGIIIRNIKAKRTIIVDGKENRLILM